MTSLSALNLILSLAIVAAPPSSPQVTAEASSGRVFTPSTEAAPEGLFSELDRRLRAGLVDVDHFHVLRVLAIRSPERLPPDLRVLSRDFSLRSGTRILVEAFQWVIESGDFGGPLHAILQPPAPLTHVLESTTWPLGVYYDSPDQAAYAQAVLAAADLSYAVQITELGFHQPPIEAGFAPYRIHIQDAGQGVAGYTAPYDLDPSVTHASCFSYIVIDPQLGLNGVGATVAHEINHSMQAAMDCIEVTAFWEHTAMYIEGVTHPDYLASAQALIPSTTSSRAPGPGAARRAPSRVSSFPCSSYSFSGGLWETPARARPLTAAARCATSRAG